jgi:hypothetical protein
MARAILPNSAQGRAPLPRAVQTVGPRWQSRFWADYTINISERKFPTGTALIMAMSDRKSQLITMLALISALAVIGLALTGTLQMRASRSPIAYVVTK